MVLCINLYACVRVCDNSYLLFVAEHMALAGQC